VDTQACKCLLINTYRLPGAHELAEYTRVSMPIPLDCIDGYWTELDMLPSAPINREIIEDLDNRLAEEIEIINQHFLYQIILKR